jgi:hypothetical protein
MMKALPGLLSVLLLCSCATAPMVTTSFNGNTYASGPTSVDDPRLRSAQFYMNDDGPPVAGPAPAQPYRFRGVDAFCAADCQANRHSPESCARACGY